ANEAVALGDRLPHLFFAPRLERLLAEERGDLHVLEEEEEDLAKIRLVPVDRLDGLGHVRLLSRQVTGSRPVRGSLWGGSLVPVLARPRRARSGAVAFANEYSFSLEAPRRA